MELGYHEGEVCNRRTGDVKRCAGIISMREVENCSCHIAPPCNACVDLRSYCDECGWDGVNDSRFNDHIGYTNNAVSHTVLELRPLDPTKLDWHSKSHSNSSMIKEGVYPLGMSIEDVRKKVDGTFGGRFEYFHDGKFKFIAYTD
jgi:hypothetical protein